MILKIIKVMVDEYKVKTTENLSGVSSIKKISLLELKS